MSSHDSRDPDCLCNGCIAWIGQSVADANLELLRGETKAASEVFSKDDAAARSVRPKGATQGGGKRV